MRERHFPRLCRSCEAPMARKEDTCWRCGVSWIDRERKPLTRGALPGSVSRRRAGTPELLVYTPPTADAAILVPA